MGSYEDETPWRAGLKNRTSDGSLRNAMLKTNDLTSSMMSEAVGRSQLVVNPWDAAEGEDVHEGTAGMSDSSHGVTTNSDLAASRPYHSGNRLDQPQLLTDHHPPPVLTNGVSTSSLVDYTSPTAGSMSPPEPESDPWQTTPQKLDDALKGMKIVVERPEDDGDSGVGSGAARSRFEGGSPESPRVPSRAPDSFQWFLDMERVKVTIAPEKAGLLWKHVNYILESQQRHIAVLRRYSDFIWLLDILHKRYPFRILPSLPPKRLGGMNSGGDGNAAFLERRRRGLSRFINVLANHPVLREDECVIAFLTVEMEIYEYRRKAPIPTDEENSSNIPNSLVVIPAPEDLDERIAKFRDNLVPLIGLYRDMCILMERLSRRTDGSALDFLRYSAVLKKLEEHPDCTSSECANCPQINIGYAQISGGFQRVGRIMEEQAQATFDGILENLKAHRDLLSSCHDMFSRRDRALSQMTIDSLYKRIGTNEAKLAEVRAKDGPQKEIDRLKLLIEQDRSEVETQQRRIAFIRRCTWQELQYFHHQKAFISLLYQGYVSEQMRFSEQFAEVWKTLSLAVFELPTTGFV
ncbi:Sorting nexin mvp1 [Borealophlyctis nickersoniae]|nr:Sorting nexin mvp1 [Borealophlyctis nickersoniae]